MLQKICKIDFSRQKEVQKDIFMPKKDIPTPGIEPGPCRHNEVNYSDESDKS
jgi:hypothetical protein